MAGGAQAKNLLDKKRALFGLSSQEPPSQQRRNQPVSKSLGREPKTMEEDGDD